MTSNLQLFRLRDLQDYSLRAKDYNKKKKRLKILREKVAERNPDEFHFGMMSGRTNGGKKVTDRGNKALSVDAVKLLKTQDAGYLKTVAQQTRKVREKLEQGIFLGHGRDVRQNMSLLKGHRNSKDPEHIMFVENKEEQQKFELIDVCKAGSKTLPQPTPKNGESDNQSLKSEEEIEAEDKAVNKRLSTKKRLEARAEISRIKSALRKRRKREQESRKAKLEALKVREQDLMAAERELELQRAKMSSSVGGVTKAGVKWKVRERKR